MVVTAYKMSISKNILHKVHYVMQMFVNGSIKMNLLKEAVQQNSSIVEGIFQFLSYNLGGNFRWLPLFYRNS